MELFLSCSVPNVPISEISYFIDLPKSNIEASVGVIVHSTRISSTLMRNNTLAASSIPVMLCAPGGNIHLAFNSPARTRRTFATGAVSSTS